MNREIAVAKLKARARAIRALGATALYLYGSTARDKAKPNSDIDVFVEYDPAKSFSLFDLAGIKVLLEDELATDVHITTRDSLHPLMRRGIEHDAIRIF